MTRLLEEAISRLRRLPEAMQDNAARALIYQLDEEPESGDQEALDEARQDFLRGDFVAFDQWRHEMGLGDR